MTIAPKYKPYPEYKPSGVEWLGEVPKHWDASRLGKYFEERREKVSDKNYPPLSVTMKGIVPQLETAAKTDAGDNRKKVSVGDFAINSRSDRKGSSGLSELEGSVSLISIVLTPRKIEGSFVHHLLRSQPFQEEFYRYGKGIVADLWSTNYSEMKNIILPIPPLPEQRAIAAFLDRETGKIDRMIGKQERMIELLKEKRQAVISNAVTKGIDPTAPMKDSGIDPTAPMKDSGIEWLGQIPEHWKALQLRHCLNGMEQGKSPSCENRMTEEGEWGVLKSGCVNRGEFNQNEHKALPSTAEPFSEYEVKRGDLLMSRASGSRDLIGSVGYVSEVKSRLLLSDKTFRLKTKPLADKLFLSHEMSSQVVRRQIELAINGAEGLANNITQSSIRSFYIALPPIDEQKEIVQFLERETAKIDHLIAKAEQAIELMKERRTALISAAVTGKIDVSTYASTHAGRRDGSSNAYCVTDDTPELMAAEEQAEYRVKE